MRPVKTKHQSRVILGIGYNRALQVLERSSIPLWRRVTRVYFPSTCISGYASMIDDVSAMIRQEILEREKQL